MHMTLFKGAGVALVTPFENGLVDYKRLAGLIDWQITSGIDAIISCGTTGEASTLTDEEHVETVKFTIEMADGRVPVLAGAGSNDIAHAIQMAQELEELRENNDASQFLTNPSQELWITKNDTYRQQSNLNEVVYS